MEDSRTNIVSRENTAEKAEDRITLDYGSGGLKTSKLIESVLLPAFDNDALAALGDGASSRWQPKARIFNRQLRRLTVEIPRRRHRPALCVRNCQ